MTRERDANRVPVKLFNEEILRTRRLIGILATVAAVAALLFWFATTLRADGNHDMFNLVDVGVYRAGAQAVLDGRPLYEPVMGPLYFTSYRMLHRPILQFRCIANVPAGNVV